MEIITYSTFSNKHELTDDYMDHINTFALCMEGSRLPQSTYNNLRRFFQHKLHMDTEYLMYWQIELLSGVTPILYGMCDQSCCLLIDSHKEHTQCPECHNPRYHANGKPIARFPYLPIIPWLIAWYESLLMIECLKYHSTHESIEGQVSTVFDGSHYHSLLNTYVEVEGAQLGHKYFLDHRDIALRGSTDGFQVHHTPYFTQTKWLNNGTRSLLFTLPWESRGAILNGPLFWSTSTLALKYAHGLKFDFQLLLSLAPIPPNFSIHILFHYEKNYISSHEEYAPMIPNLVRVLISIHIQSYSQVTSQLCPSFCAWKATMVMHPADSAWSEDRHWDGTIRSALTSVTRLLT
jgi:hypothetical protein